MARTPGVRWESVRILSMQVTRHWSIASNSNLRKRVDIYTSRRHDADMKAEKPMMLREVMDEYGAGAEAMVRTQVYLSRAEHDFLLSESGRRGITMAGLIRSIVDEKMAVPDKFW